MESGGGGKPTPVNNLPLGTLKELSAEVEGRCEQLAEAVAQLNGALARYEEIGAALGQLETAREGAELLVPLTDSMYAVGSMEETGRVMVDIGTGYYVEKTLEQAREFVERRSAFVRKQVTTLDAQLDTQTRNLEQLTLVLQSKQQQQQQQQQQMGRAQ